MRVSGRGRERKCGLRPAAPILVVPLGPPAPGPRTLRGRVGTGGGFRSSGRKTWAQQGWRPILLVGSEANGTVGSQPGRRLCGPSREACSRSALPGTPPSRLSVPDYAASATLARPDRSAVPVIRVAFSALHLRAVLRLLRPPRFSAPALPGPGAAVSLCSASECSLGSQVLDPHAEPSLGVARGPLGTRLCSFTAFPAARAWAVCCPALRDALVSSCVLPVPHSECQRGNSPLPCCRTHLTDLLRL